jgi:hypothetical protein
MDEIKADVAELKVDSKLLQESMIRLESRMDSIEASGVRTEDKIDKVLNILDGFAGKVATLDQENKMGSITLRRHDIQIHELATATGTAISD